MKGRGLFLFVTPGVFQHLLTTSLFKLFSYTTWLVLKMKKKIYFFALGRTSPFKNNLPFTNSKKETHFSNLKAIQVEPLVFSRLFIA